MIKPALERRKIFPGLSRSRFCEPIISLESKRGTGQIPRIQIPLWFSENLRDLTCPSFALHPCVHETLPTGPERIRRPSRDALSEAESAFRGGVVAAADGTISPVPLVAGTKIQIGVVIVSNRGDIVQLVTRVFETELSSGATSAGEFFADLRTARSISNLLSRAIMLFGERRLLLEHQAEWRLLHGELIPHELRTGAGRPEQNLPPAFQLVHDYIATGKFIAVSEASDDIDILNAAILLQPGEYIVIRSLADTLETFLQRRPYDWAGSGKFC